MRLNGWKIRVQPPWGNESSINIHSVSKNNLSIEHSVELTSSDINFGKIPSFILLDKISNSSMTDEMLGIIKTMSKFKRSESFDKLKRAKTWEENNLNSLYKNMGKNSEENNLNKSSGSVKKLKNQDKNFLLKIQEIGEGNKTQSFEIKEENGKIK